MIKRVSCVIILVLSLVVNSKVVSAADALSFVAGAAPKIDAQPNERYGIVKFSFQSVRGGKPTSDPLKVLMDTLGRLLNKKGEYILTLEVLPENSNDPIARKAILQSKREESGFLIFNRVVKESTQTEWYGDITKDILIRADTNKVRLRVRSYYTKDTKFDLNTFNLILDFIAKTKTLGAAPDLQAAWKPITDQMEKLLKQYEESEVSDTVTLSFVNFPGGATAYPQSGTFFRKIQVTENENERIYEAKIKIELEPVKTRLVTLTAAGKVDDPFWPRVLSVARVGDVLLETFLANSKDGDVKKFMAGLVTDKGYGEADIGAKCTAMFKEISTQFSNADSLVAYWALMFNFDGKLSLNKASADCLKNSYRLQLTKLGLPYDDLRFLKAPAEQPAVAASAPEEIPKLKTGDIKKIEEIVGPDGKSFTYESVPLSNSVQVQ